MPLLWLSLSFLIGVILAGFLDWPANVWLALGTISIVLFGLQVLARRYLPGLAGWFSTLAARVPHFPNWASPKLSVFVLFAALSFGGARIQAAQPHISVADIAWHNDKDEKFVIEGILYAPPDERDTYTLLSVQVDRLRTMDAQLFGTVSGHILARIPSGKSWKYGDRIRLEGYLRTPPEDESFSYREYLERRKIFSLFSCGWDQDTCARLLLHDQGNPLLAWIYTIKSRALEKVYQLFPDPEASLLAGILLGVESGIPEEVMRAFEITGTSHVIVISGFNFAIVAALFAGMFGRVLGRWRGMLAAIAAIALYAVLVGPEAAVVRAAIMGGLAVFAAQMGRRQHGINTLAFVAALMALFNPFVLWDVGFQLSFAATLGLMLYAEPLTNAFVNLVANKMPVGTAKRLAGPVGEYFLFTLAAQVTTLPIILYHFQRLSLASLLANPLILPAQPPVMILGGLAVIVGMLSVSIGKVVAFLVWPFIVYTIRVVEALATLPSASLALGKVSLFAVIMFYAVLIAWTVAGEPAHQRILAAFSGSQPKLAMGSLLGIGLISIMVWRTALSMPDGRLHLFMIDVGSGEALLVQSTEGRYILVNGGSSPSRLSDALGRRLPFGNRTVDYLVVAAPGDEQIGALPGALDRFPPSNVLWAGPTAGSYSARTLREKFAVMQLPVMAAEPGQVLDLGSGAHLDILEVSRRGAILLLRMGKFNALLPVGLEFETMEALQNIRGLAPVDVLMLAESGYGPLNPVEWVAHWQPKLILLSVGAGDSLGRPDPDTLEAVKGYSLLRTDLNGWIHLSTDGEQLWIEVEQR